MIRRAAALPALVLLLALTGPALAQRAPAAVENDERLAATLWVQRSVEFEQIARQAYQLAALRLPAALDTPGSAALEQVDGGAGKPPAVIFDVDETVLDNSPYEARMIHAGRPGFDRDLWDAWVSERGAKAVPGAVDFVAALRAAGVTPIFVTNRDCRPRPPGGDPCPQHADTLANLAAAGFGDLPPGDLMLKDGRPDWTGDKATRRAKAASRYRIVMEVGDQFSDLLSVSRKDGTDRRAALAADHEAMFALRWVVIPNPMYGAWLDVLPAPRSGSLVP